MKLESLVTVIIRVSVLLLGLEIITKTIPSLWALTQAYNSASIGFDFQAALGPILIILIMLVVATLIWAFSEKISKLVIGKLENEVSLGNLTLCDCYSIAFVGVGLFFIVYYLPTVITWVDYGLRFESSGADQFDYYGLFQSVAPLIFGVFLFFYGRSWAIKFAKKHKDTKPDS